LSVPHIAVVVIITSKEHLAGLGEGDRCNTTQNLVIRILIELHIGADVEETARAVVGAGSEGVAIREESDTVDVGFVASEGLDASFLCAMISQFGGGVARTGDEIILGITDGDAHHITLMVIEDGFRSFAFDVPQDTGGITRRGDDFIVM